MQTNRQEVKVELKKSDLLCWAQYEEQVEQFRCNYQLTPIQKNIWTRQMANDWSAQNIDDKRIDILEIE